MAIEIKTIIVKNDDVQSTIEFWSRFAWVCASSYSYSVNNESDRLSDETAYIKLVFERDKDMPNYSRIVELEEQYLNISKKLPGKRFDNLKSFAQSFSDDYRNRDEKIVMNSIRIALLIAAVFAISKKALFLILLIVLASTFIIGNELKDKAFEENIADSKSKVCKAYRKYLNNIFKINAINNELCVLH